MGPACACPAVWAWTPPSPRSTACPRAATWACPVGPVAGAAFPGSALAEAPAGALSAPPSQSMSLRCLESCSRREGGLRARHAFAARSESRWNRPYVCALVGWPASRFSNSVSASPLACCCLYCSAAFSRSVVSSARLCAIAPVSRIGHRLFCFFFSFAIGKASLSAIAATSQSTAPFSGAGVRSALSTCSVRTPISSSSMSRNESSRSRRTAHRCRGMACVVKSSKVRPWIA
mmetsp:Transcript_11646/g.29504  ORF Transcript_11646/g.29504 Transcript_11646/m.29504 type:complete len:233 (-) Transcript_11646:501-1199(-)